MLNKKLILLDFFIKDQKWQEHLLIKQKAIEELISFTLEYLGLKPLHTAECSIILTNDEEIQIHNKKFRNKDRPTNTLSFPSEKLDILNQSSIKTMDGYLHLGDMIFSIETISNEAEKQHKNFYDHFYHLLLHSLLHLLGYEHETIKDQSIMEDIEIKILDKLGIKNPYE